MRMRRASAPARVPVPVVRTAALHAPAAAPSVFDDIPLLRALTLLRGCALERCSQPSASCVLSHAASAGPLRLSSGLRWSWRQYKNDGFGHFEAAPETRAVLDGLGQHFLAHIGAKVPQLQAEEVDKIRAARGLFNIMSRGQLAKVLGITSVVELASTSAVALETSFVLMAVEAWSAGAWTHLCARGGR